MGVPITYKIGVETFDNDFRERVLNKHADFQTPEEVAAYFDSPCIMVGIKGQTKEMIDRDIRILKKYSGWEPSTYLPTIPRPSDRIRSWCSGLSGSMNG